MQLVAGLGGGALQGVSGVGERDEESLAGEGRGDCVGLAAHSGMLRNVGEGLKCGSYNIEQQADFRLQTSWRGQRRAKQRARTCRDSVMAAAACAQILLNAESPSEFKDLASSLKNDAVVPKRSRAAIMPVTYSLTVECHEENKLPDDSWRKAPVIAVTVDCSSATASRAAESWERRAWISA